METSRLPQNITLHLIILYQKPVQSYYIVLYQISSYRIGSIHLCSNRKYNTFHQYVMNPNHQIISRHITSLNDWYYLTLYNDMVNDIVPKINQISARYQHKTPTIYYQKSIYLFYHYHYIIISLFKWNTKSNHVTSIESHHIIKQNISHDVYVISHHYFSICILKSNNHITNYYKIYPILCRWYHITQSHHIHITSYSEHHFIYFIYQITSHI